MPADRGITFKAKRMFFDRAAVIAMAGKNTARAMSKFGAFVRRAARSSIRRRKKVSAPGTPPSAHSADPVATIKNILFSWDPVTRSVVVGPVRLNIVHAIRGAYVSGVVPHTLEFGGTVGIPESQIGGQWVRADMRSKRRIAEHPFRIRKAKYQARPFMAPALAREIPNMPKAWAAAVQR